MFWRTAVQQLLYLIIWQFNFPACSAKNHNVNEQVVQPEQYYDWLHARRKLSLETNIKEAPGHHHTEVFYAINLNKAKHKLDLTLNKYLLPQNFGFTHFLQDGSEHTYYPSEEERNHCYYEGTVRGFRESIVRLSTCNGLRGIVILDGDIHVIEPLKSPDLKHDQNAHIVYKAQKDQMDVGTCGNSDHSEDAVSFVSKLLKATNITRKLRHKRAATNEKKFVELLVVADNAMTKGMTKVQLDEKIKNVVNHLDGIYSQLGIRVVLSHIEAWTKEDKIPFKTNAKDVLNEFLNYRQKKLTEQAQSSNPTAWGYADNVQLLYGNSFDGSTIGMATVGTMCGSRSGGVNENKRNLLSVAATLAHEMGHNFGMSHDTPGCICPDKTHCIMASSAGYANEKAWSSCSKEYLANGLNLGLGNCLLNVPPPSRIYGGPKCGNDIVEKGEQCDCGLPEDCASKCCNASTCLLRDNAECDTGPCCESCTYSRGGKPCRGTNHNVCDLPEYCTGHSPYCPGNVYMENGRLCDGGKALCMDGVCLSYNLQCRNIWGEGAANSDGICYRMINSKGDGIGNCGKHANGAFKKCTSPNVMCGKLQCQGGNRRPIFASDKVQWNNRITVGETVYICKTTSSDLNATDVSDQGLVKDGSLCGDNKICTNGECKAAPPLLCERTCSGHGVCNNLGHCHCNAGWSPPFCNKKGTGGSVDSGPISDSVADTQMILMIVMFVVVLPIILGLGTFVWYKYCGGRAYVQTMRKNREQRLEAVRRNKLRALNKQSGVKTASKTNLIDPPPPPQPQPAVNSAPVGNNVGWTTDPSTVTPWSDQSQSDTSSTDHWQNSSSYAAEPTSVQFKPTVSTPSRPPPPKPAPPKQAPPQKPPAPAKAPPRPQAPPPVAPPGAPPPPPAIAKPQAKPPLPATAVLGNRQTTPARSAPPPPLKPKSALPPSMTKRPHHGSNPSIPSHPKPALASRLTARPQSGGEFTDISRPDSPSDASNLSVMEKARLFGQHQS